MATSALFLSSSQAAPHRRKARPIIPLPAKLSLITDADSRAHLWDLSSPKTLEGQVRWFRRRTLPSRKDSLSTCFRMSAFRAAPDGAPGIDAMRAAAPATMGAAALVPLMRA